MKKLPHPSKPILMWSLFWAVIFFAAAWALGKWFKSEDVRQVAKFAFLLSATTSAIMLLPLLSRHVLRSAGWCGKTIGRVLLPVWAFYRWLNFRRIVFLALGFCALVFLFYVEEDYRGWHAWQQFKHEWEAKGEHFDFASVIPPPVPDDQNFALTPIVANSYGWILTRDGKLITPHKTNVVEQLWMFPRRLFRGSVPASWEPEVTNGNWVLGEFCDLTSWQNYYRTRITNAELVADFPVSPKIQSPAQDVLFALSKYNPAIEELRKASALPYSRFPLNYNAEDPDRVMLPHLSRLRSCVEALRLRSLAELELNQSNAALEDIKLSFRLMDATRTEPNVISHSERRIEFLFVIQPVWEGLMKHKWSDAQLAVIEQDLGMLDFLKDIQLALRGERNNDFAKIDYLKHRRPSQEFQRMFAPGFVSVHTDEDERRWKRQETKAAIFWRLAPSGWFYQNKVIIGKAYQQWMLNIADPSKQQAYPQVQEAASKFIGSLPHQYWNSLARRLLPAGSATIENLCYAQESSDLARIACALERYRLAHDGYPESLDALAPQFIDKIPHDIIGGKPLHYRRTADGKYLLYSIGWNETDEGGTIYLAEFGHHDLAQGDWVWSCP